MAMTTMAATSIPPVHQRWHCRHVVAATYAPHIVQGPISTELEDISESPTVFSGSVPSSAVATPFLPKAEETAQPTLCTLRLGSGLGGRALVPACFPPTVLQRQLARGACDRGHQSLQTCGPQSSLRTSAACCRRRSWRSLPSHPL
eukprot:350001-Chlamydomonas_euryale.AAC.6